MAYVSYDAGVSSTVAELNALMTCCGTCLFLCTLGPSVGGEVVPIPIGTDANNIIYIYTIIIIIQYLMVNNG